MTTGVALCFSFQCGEALLAISLECCQVCFMLLHGIDDAHSGGKASLHHS